MNAGIFVSTDRRDDTEGLCPEAVAILADPGLPLAARRCLERFFRWGAAPTVDGYCDLFAPAGTLLDADMAEPITGAAIRESITRVLTLLPDFRFAPRRVLSDGPHVFVLAANRATLGDRPLAWDAIYALTLGDDRIAAGRRYYDQAALLDGSETFAIPAPNGGPPAEPAREGAELDVGMRADAWNRHDVAALAGPLGPARLYMAGVARPLTATTEIVAALGAFARRSGGLTVAPGAVVRTAHGTGIEWVGTIGAGATARRFAFVELALQQPCEWRVLFNTFGL